MFAKTARNDARGQIEIAAVLTDADIAVCTDRQELLMTVRQMIAKAIFAKVMERIGPAIDTALKMGEQSWADNGVAVRATKPAE